MSRLNTLHSPLQSVALNSMMIISTLVTLDISGAVADTVVVTEGDTVVITNQAPRKRRRARARSILPSSNTHQVCFLEHVKTGEQSLITSPTRAQLRRSKVIWCQEREADKQSERAKSPQSKVRPESQRTQRAKPKRRRAQSKRSLPRRAEAFRGFVEGAAEKYGLPEALLWAFMKVESDFIPTAVSRKGAQGLMQLMPFTARDMGVKDAFNPKQNIYGAARLISILMKRFKGELPLVISAYHAGGGAVTKREGIPYSETSQYMTSVLNAYYRYMKRPPYLRDDNQR